jgi:hypothetical protein
MVNDVAPRAQWRGRWQMADGRWHGGGPTEVLLRFVNLQHFSFLVLYVNTEFDDVVFCF